MPTVMLIFFFLDNFEPCIRSRVAQLVLIGISVLLQMIQASSPTLTPSGRSQIEPLTDNKHPRPERLLAG